MARYPWAATFVSEHGSDTIFDQEGSHNCIGSVWVLSRLLTRHCMRRFGSIIGLVRLAFGQLTGLNALEPVSIDLADTILVIGFPKGFLRTQRRELQVSLGRRQA